MRSYLILAPAIEFSNLKTFQSLNVLILIQNKTHPCD